MNGAPVAPERSSDTARQARSESTQVDSAGASQQALVEELVHGCLLGDQCAYRSLYRHCAPGVQRHLAVLLGPGGDVEDAMQQVFLTLFGKLGEYDARRAKFSTWIYGITQRVALNVRRGSRRRRSALGSLTDDVATRRRRSTGPDERIDRSERLRRLYGYLDTMSEKKREAFLLHFVEGLDVKDVAIQLGTSSATAWARIDRARAALIALVAREHDALNALLEDAS